MNWKKIFGVLAVIFIGWYVISSPHAAAATWDSVKSGVEGAFNSLSTFFTSVTP